MRHPETGIETLERDWASSMYEGGKLYYAADCSHADSKRLGLVCPLCSEAVLLAKGEVYRPTWRHYRLSVGSQECDRRVLTKEGKETLRQLQPKSAGQRLSLFNRRFWDIYRYEKAMPRDIRKATIALAELRMAESGVVRKFTQLDDIIKHCWDRWDIEAILKSLPEKISKLGDPCETFDSYLSHESVKPFVDLDPDLVLEVYESLTSIKFSILRHKILSEVIEWLGSRSALPSFAKVATLAMFDCLELRLFSLPIHTNAIANMMVTSLIATDWERAIAHVTSKGGNGFG